MELNGGEKPIKVLNIIGVLSESGEFIPEAENDPDFN
jgi:hypothetical protein